MIQITMQFASLAEAMQFLQKAERPEAAVVVETEVKPPKERKPKPEPQPAAEPPAPAPQPEAEAPAPAPAADEPQVTQTVTYEDLQKSVAKAVARDPNIVRAVLGELGLSTFKGSDASVWPVAKEKLDAKVAAYA